MQIAPTNTVTQAATAAVAGVPARVLAGNLAAVPVGTLLNATVTGVTAGQAVLTVNGQTLTVRPPPGTPLQSGAVLLVRVPPSAPNATNPTLELNVPSNASQGQTSAAGIASQTTAGVSTALSNAIGRAANSATAATTPATTGTPATPAPRLAVVDVLAALPDGRVRVQIDGEERTATTAEPLTAGGRYVLQVSQTASGLALKSPPDSPTLPTQIATAILRTPAATLSAALKPLQDELAALTAQPSGTPSAQTTPSAVPARAGTTALAGALATTIATTTPTAVQVAASAVRDTLRTFLPTDSRPPNATELKNLVENGGLHFEAKLARLVAEPDTTTNTQAPATPTTDTTTRSTQKATAPEQKSDAASGSTSDRSAAPSIRDVGPDLKGDLLRLLQSVQDLGGAVRAPAAQAALGGVEVQQAANALAQENAAPYYLQVPFPDGAVWRTMHLSLEPQTQPDRPDADRAGRFRVFMHVPLTDLGETWIDAGVAGDQFRATIYLDQQPVRDRVQAALPELQTELQAEGFSEVLLTVRSSSELPDRYRKETGAMQAGRPATVSVLDVRA